MRLLAASPGCHESAPSIAASLRDHIRWLFFSGRAHPDPPGPVAEVLKGDTGLDRQTSGLLRQEDLLEAFRRDPAEAVRRLDQRWSGDLNEE